MKRMMFVLLAISLTFGFIACNDSDDNSDTLVIVSPYRDVNWQTHGQYKAALHVHTRRSDGNYNFDSVIEDHYEKGYHILTITDHNVVNTDWTSGSNSLTPARYAEITSGAGRADGRGMIRIPFTNEQSRNDHLNSFFADYNNNVSGDTLPSVIEKVADLDGLSFINHPGRYTGGQSGGTTGENASNNSANINKYVHYFTTYTTCVGMEIINKKDGESASDRILWDNILHRTMPEGRFVWGFSNDDTHYNSDTGFSFNVFVMPANTTENFRSTMLNGNFYAVARVSKRELGSLFVGTGPYPEITNIVTNESALSITITAQHAEDIDWIADGVVIFTGETILLEDHRDDISSYVRANIKGPGGIAFTQPFRVNWANATH